MPSRLGADLKEAACKSPIKPMKDEAPNPGAHAWPVKNRKCQEMLQVRRRAEERA